MIILKKTTKIAAILKICVILTKEIMCIITRHMLICLQNLEYLWLNMWSEAVSTDDDDANANTNDDNNNNNNDTSWLYRLIFAYAKWANNDTSWLYRLIFAYAKWAKKYLCTSTSLSTWFSKYIQMLTDFYPKISH